MDSVIKDIAQFRVPPPDEALTKAVADFKARLAAWTEAVLGLHQQLTDQTRRQADLQQQAQSDGDRQTQVQTELEARLAAQTKTEADLKARQEALAQAEEKLHQQAESQAKIAEELEARAAAQAQTAEALEKQAQSQAAFHAQLEERAAALGQQPPAAMPASEPLAWNSENVSKHIRVYGDLAKEPEEQEPQAESQEASEDEQLLASLDPETAKAIRVMRRMRGDKKSVRELLEQYQGAPTTKAESSKKSWFRRGR